MLLTEREAQAETCPIRRDVNRCQGSKCRMGWRWANLPDPKGVGIGYCGFAGKPEA